MNVPLVLAGIALLAVVYVLLPVFVVGLAQFRGLRRLRCPETGRQVRVGLAAPRTALAAALGTKAAWIDYCSLWPERRGCRQGCAARAAEARPEDWQPEPATTRD